MRLTLTDDLPLVTLVLASGVSAPIAEDLTPLTECQMGSDPRYIGWMQARRILVVIAVLMGITTLVAVPAPRKTARRHSVPPADPPRAKRDDRSGRCGRSTRTPRAARLGPGRDDLLLLVTSEGEDTVSMAGLGVQRPIRSPPSSTC